MLKLCAFDVIGTLKALWKKFFELSDSDLLRFHCSWFWCVSQISLHLFILVHFYTHFVYTHGLLLLLGKPPKLDGWDCRPDGAEMVWSYLWTKVCSGPDGLRAKCNVTLKMCLHIWPRINSRADNQIFSTENLFFQMYIKRNKNHSRWNTHWCLYFTCYISHNWQIPHNLACLFSSLNVPIMLTFIYQ